MLLAELRSRGISPPFRAGDLIDRSYPIVRDEEPLRRALETLLRSRRRLAVVLDSRGHVRGVLDSEDLEELVELSRAKPDTKVSQVPLRRPPILRPSARVEEVLDSMVSSGLDYVVVVDGAGRLLGVITVDEVDEALAFTLVGGKS